MKNNWTRILKAEKRQEREALAHFLNVPVDELKPETGYGDIPLFVHEDRAYAITDNEEVAYEAAVQQEMSMLEDMDVLTGILWDRIGGKESFVNTEWFKEAIEEMEQAYVDDIARELPIDQEKYENRLQEEMAENGVESEEEYVELLVQNAGDPVQFYIDNFGEQSFYEVVDKYNLVNIRRLAEAIVNSDGVESILSIDGNEHVFEYGGKQYLIYLTYY